MVCGHVRDDLVAHHKAAGGVRVAKRRGRFRRSYRAHRARAGGEVSINRRSINRRLFHGVRDTRWQARSRLRLAVDQRKRRRPGMIKLHLTTRATHALVRQAHRILKLRSRSTRHGIAHRERTRLARVDEGKGLRLCRHDGLLYQAIGREACKLFLSRCAHDARRQPRQRLFLPVRERKGRHAINELKIAVGTRDAPVRELHRVREGALVVGVGALAHLV